MSRILDSISTIISIFQEYSYKDGDSSTLSRSRMKEFVQREFADALAKPHDPQTIEKILQFLEWDGDGDIDFNEFLLLVFRVAKCCYRYQPRAPYLVQRTKLTTGGKTLREPEIRNRGSRRQLQEEEQTCERNCPCEPELQRDTRVSELEISEESRRDPQRRPTRSRNGAELSREPGEPIPQEYEERSGQRRRQPPGQGQLRGGRAQERELGRLVGEREEREGSQREEVADVRIRSRSSEARPRPDRWSGRGQQEPEGPACDERNQRPRGADGGSDNQPHRPGLLREERSRYHQQELEQRALERSSHRERGECLDLRHPHQSHIEEPLELDLRGCDRAEPEERVREQRTKQEREMEYAEREREIREDQEWEEREDPRRRRRLRERRIDCQGELEVEVSESRSHLTQDREDRGVTIDQRQTRERRETCEDDGRRERESVIYERTRDTRVAAAEADVKIHREIRELEPREELRRRECPRECEEEERRILRGREREEPFLERRIDRQRELEVSERRKHQTRDREERGVTIDQRQTRERHETCEPVEDERRQRESVRYERTRDTRVAAAEADVKVHREIRELEPREELRRRECPRECEEEERRICRRRGREEPVLERRIDRQRELEVSERRSRQTRDREDRGVTIDRRETRERRETCEPVEDERRQRESVRYERARESRVAEAEADVKIHREIRELEPCEELRRRECPRECEEEERRICRRRGREEPVLERTIDRQRELEVEVSERRSRLTRDREERGVTVDRRETRESRVAEAEADVKVHREIRELEPCDDLRRRECPRECEEEERRILRGREREEPFLERTVDRQRELEVSERRSHLTRDREERGVTIDQRQTRERRETCEPVEDERRERESVRYERTRDTRVAAAEADVKIHREIRELEPREELRRRECPRECEEEERRICRRDREEPVLERTIDLQQELEVSERRSRLTRDREERGVTIDQRQTRQLEGDGRRQRESVRYERTRDTRVAAAEADVKVHREIRELEPCEELRRRECPREREEEERRILRGREREEPVLERRIDRQRELEVSERRSRLTRDREERGVTIDQRQTRERHETCEDDGRRERESVRYERTRESRVAEAEADVKIHREIRELEPCEELRRRECPRECEEEERRICRRREREEPVLERTIDRQRELEVEVSERRSRLTRDREERGVIIDQREIRELEGDGRRERESVRYERTRDTRVAAAEADVKIHREIRGLEPREDLRRRECPRECEEEERRICRRRGREEPVLERTTDHQQELEVEVSERRSRLTRDREERGVTVDQRQTRELDGDGRRQRESVRYERTRDTRVAAAEADVKVHREIRELDPCEDLRRRECPRECEEEERRILRGREREEPFLERRTDRQRELEVSERRSRLTRDREERGVTIDQRQTRERCETCEPVEDERRQRESVRYERARESRVAEAEADVKIHREIRELEPCEELRRRECPRECEEEERRICRRDREEPFLERTIDRQRELEVSERRSRLTRDREERGVTIGQRQTRESRVAEAEADVKVHREIRELEPRAELRRRERPCESKEEERRILRGREREEPFLERTVDRQRELEVSERRSRLTRDREERGVTIDQRQTRERRETCEPVEDERRQRESVRYERARESRVAAAEADVKIHREIRELEPREMPRRRECPRECEEEERRICRRRGREEPVSERRIDHQQELEVEVSERCSRLTRDREERGVTIDRRETREETILEVLEEEQEVDEGQSLYQTVEVDNRDLEEGPVSDLRVRYVPADPAERPEVRVLPQPCEPQTIAYLVHVLQNGRDSSAATYEIICHQPDNPGRPVCVRKCYVSAKPPTVPCDRSDRPEPPPRGDERGSGEAKLPPSSSQENTRDLGGERAGAGVKEGAHQASACEPDAVKGDARRGKTKEIPDTEKNQPQGDGSKAAREKVPREPGSSCQVREREDRKAKSCPPLLQAPEPREARESDRRDADESRPRAPRREETGRVRQDVELLPPEKSCQEETCKRSPRQVGDSQVPREEEPRPGTKQSQGTPGLLISQEEPSRPAGDEAKAS